MMTVQEKMEYWLDIAEYDLETAKSMFKSRRYLYTVFMCQQALEKMIKAHYILEKGKEAPRSHNLSYLAGLTALNLDESQLSFFDRLTAFYIQGRYPTYKEKLSKATNRTQAKSYLKQAKEMFGWLKSLLT
jgi:HEPN domain-containing protein